MSALWHRDDDGWKLLPAAGFPDEATLHALVEEAPQVLPLSGSPTLVVVGREVQLGTGWADLVAVEASGRIVVIEVKLAKNPDAPRAVVSQVLAYASALYRLEPGAFEQHVLEPHLKRRGLETLTGALDASGIAYDADAFAAGLEESLANGRFRLVIVLDDGPDHLVRLVAYLEAVTEGLIIDLVTVASYEIDGSQILVPQRVEPERLPPPTSRATATEDASRLTPGAAAFREAIANAPEDKQPVLTRLANWAENLEREGVTNLYTRHDARGPRHLIPQLKVEKVGLMTIWGDGVTWLWPSVFKRRAPGSIQRVEAALGARLDGQHVAVSDPHDELLEALSVAYREAAGSRTESIARIGGSDAASEGL